MYQRNKQKSTSLRQRKYLHKEKDYSNPFFEQKNKKTIVVSKNSLPVKIKLIFSGIFLSAFLFIWFLLYSGYFTIDIVEARGGGRIDHAIIESYAWEQVDDSNFVFWPQKNLLLFSKNELIQTLNVKYSFNGIVVNKKLPNKLLIDYNEKEHSLIWFEKDIYYYTDNHGYVVERIGDKTEEKNYPLVKNLSSYAIDGNRVAIKQEIIDYVFLIIERMKQYPEFQIDHFIIEDNVSTVKLQLKDGPKLIFSINVGIERQLNKIVTLKKDILKEDFAKKDYIDVRTGDRVYYR